MNMENEIVELKTRIALLERLVLSLSANIEDTNITETEIIKKKPSKIEHRKLINNIRRRVI
jgi:hypothetical protein